MFDVNRHNNAGTEMCLQESWKEGADSWSVANARSPVGEPCCARRVMALHGPFLAAGYE